MHLFDTDTLRHLYADHPRVLQRLRELPPAEVVGTTIITKAEMLRGRLDFLLKAAAPSEFFRAQDLLAKTEELLRRTVIVGLDEAALEHFERLRGTKGLKTIGRADLLIASIVLANSATLVTRNLKHFQRVPQLQVVNWVD
jgi:tRNA(fMet)-specific endonuclease VapC